MAANFLLNRTWMLRLIGVLNKRICLIESLFLMYPANEAYALAYVYPNRLARVKWNPWPCGIAVQNWRLIIKFCISTRERDFLREGNADYLKDLRKRMEEFRLLLGAQRVTYAGSLPSIFVRRRIVEGDQPEADLTARVVVKAIRDVKMRESQPSNLPEIIIGGNGYVGRRVLRLLNGANRACVDASAANATWPSWLLGKPAIIVNIANKGAVMEHIDNIAPGSILLNEVYPEPDTEVVEKLRAKGCKVYHIAGVKGSPFPSFPMAYKGAIPCCAALPSKSMRVLVRELSC